MTKFQLQINDEFFHFLQTVISILSFFCKLSFMVSSCSVNFIISGLGWLTYHVTMTQSPSILNVILPHAQKDNNDVKCCMFDLHFFVHAKKQLRSHGTYITEASCFTYHYNVNIFPNFKKLCKHQFQQLHNSPSNGISSLNNFSVEHLFIILD